MDHQQQELRRAAAQAFAESLNKLEQTLCIPEDEPTPPSYLLDLEQAVADIEQFIQSQESEAPIQNEANSPSEK
jgi:protein-tyrosine phosphatase